MNTANNGRLGIDFVIKYINKFAEVFILSEVEMLFKSYLPNFLRYYIETLWP